jgi:hypothetical protein
MDAKRAEILSISPNPSDWLASFEWFCGEAAGRRMPYISIFRNLIMMGRNDGDSRMPADYDNRLLAILRKHGLIGRMRRLLAADRRKPVLEDGAFLEALIPWGMYRDCSSEHAEWLAEFLKERRS